MLPDGRTTLAPRPVPLLQPGLRGALPGGRATLDPKHSRQPPSLLGFPASGPRKGRAEQGRHGGASINRSKSAGVFSVSPPCFVLPRAFPDRGAVGREGKAAWLRPGRMGGVGSFERCHGVSPVHRSSLRRSSSSLIAWCRAMFSRRLDRCALSGLEASLGQPHGRLRDSSIAFVANNR